MKPLVFLLILAPLYVSCDDFFDLLGQEAEDIYIEHIRDKRQSHYRPFSQAPAQIQQILQAQQAREPLVHIPAQPRPQLGPSRPAEPQYQSQGQVSQYRPQVQYANAPQQPTYKQIPVAPAQYRPPQPVGHPQANYPQQRQGGQPNYRGLYQPAQQPQAAAQPRYNPNLPPQLKQLVQLQQQFPNTVPVSSGQQSSSKVFQPSQQRLH